MITIKNVRAIATAPGGINLVVVKVETSEPGLYGLGCATFAYRVKTVVSMIEDYLAPLLIGRDVSNIEDLWQLMNCNSYWRNGPITNNAISGVDMALWDIKGKLANMPVYSLLGGKCREGVPIYSHANGTDNASLIEHMHQIKDKGVRYIRCQLGGYEGISDANVKPINAPQGIYLDPDRYCINTVNMFEAVRKEFGFGLEVLHDVHERIAPIEAVRLAKYLEPFRLFFLEDLLSPEQGAWFEQVRQHAAVPIAQGELFNNSKEYDYLIANRLIDFIRVHVSQIGGLTPARKLAIFCEAFGVRTAWHGPGDVSPIGHVMNLHLDLASWNFGIQEWAFIPEPCAEVFPGCPTYKDGYMYVNEAPGFGIDIDEEKAKKYPCNNGVTMWTQTRLPDGTLQRP